MSGAESSQAGEAGIGNSRIGEGEVALRLSGLGKRFGRGGKARQALRDVSLEVGRGELFGLLGPNGAGKSTTFGIIAGLVHATAGSVEVLGRPLGDIEVARGQVGMLVETPAFYDYMSGRKNLEVLARLNGRGRAADRASIDMVLERVGLAGRAGEKVSRYSHGMKQRLGLAQAMLHGPRLLLLDEPTNGLDPETAGHAWALLRALADEEGVTVVVSSHLLHEVEEWCDRVAVLDQGVLVACDRIDRLLFFTKEDSLLVFDRPGRRAEAEALLRSLDWVEVLLPGTQSPEVAAAAGGGGGGGEKRLSWDALAEREARPRPVDVAQESHAIRVRVAQGATAEVVEALVGAGLAPRAVIPQRKTLKQFFLELTRRQPERPALG